MYLSWEGEGNLHKTGLMYLWVMREFDTNTDLLILSYKDNSFNN